MAYFRCSLGGGSGNGAVITVTYGAEFYNQTLVATNGTDTVSVLASSSGTADIAVPSEGSWVISCTIGADTYTSDPVLVELSYAATITAIPDGSTVLPTDDIETWLECAGITDKAYTTLAEVLDDTDTYTTLLGDSNACDYMARSTDWAVAEGLVPTMTDATHPSGVVSASSSYSGYPDYYAFDGNISNEWYSSQGTNEYIQYQFPNAVVVNKADIGVVYSNSYTRIKNFRIEASNDGTNYTTLYTGLATNNSANYTLTVTFENTTAYTYYRLYVIDTYAPSNYSVATFELQFYAADITTNVDAMRLLGMYDYACDAVLANSTWSDAIADSAYFESILDVCVPKMTSNTAPYGEAGASSSNGARPPYQAFNGTTLNPNDGTTFWLVGTPPGYVYYHFTQAVNVVKTKVTSKSGSTGTTQIKWMYSDDGTTWKDATQLESYSITTTRVVHEYKFPSCGAHEYWAFYIANQWAVGEVQFYGRHTAQTDIIVSAPSDTIYYMDNGSPVTLCTTDTDGIGSVDWSDLPTGDITLYSSVAKNPTDLTADYSKTINVTKNKVEGYLMPDKGVLYWYGWESADLEDCSSANGWSRSSYSQTLPTHTTNYIDCEINGSYKFSLVGTKNTLPNGTVLTAVCQGIKAPANEAGFIANYSSKTMSSSLGYVSISSLNFEAKTYTMTAQGYGTFGCNVGSTSANREIKLYAFMYE